MTIRPAAAHLEFLDEAELVEEQRLERVDRNLQPLDEARLVNLLHRLHAEPPRVPHDLLDQMLLRWHLDEGQGGEVIRPVHSTAGVVERAVQCWLRKLWDHLVPHKF